MKLTASVAQCVMDKLVRFQDVDRLIHGDVLVCCFKGMFNLDKMFYSDSLILLWKHISHYILKQSLVIYILAIKTLHEAP